MRKSKSRFVSSLAGSKLRTRRKNVTAVVYAFETLPGKTLNGILKDPGGQQFVTAELMLRIATEAENCFEAIRRHNNHIYTDFTDKNILLNPASGEVALIDLDSAWSYDVFRNHEGKPEHSEFDAHFWILWTNHILPNRNAKTLSTELLRKSMVFSFAAVWGHALGLVQSGTTFDAGMIEDITDQDKFWTALEKPDKDAFEAFFGVSKADDLFDSWRKVFEELTSWEPVPWQEVREAILKLASPYTVSSNSVKRSKPVVPPQVSPKFVPQPPPLTIQIQLLPKPPPITNPVSPAVSPPTPQSISHPHHGITFVSRTVIELKKGVTAGLTLGVWPVVKMLRDRRKPI